MAIVNRAELAELIGTSLVTVDAYRRRGMPYVSRGAKGRAWSYDTATVIKWLRDQDVAAIQGDAAGVTLDEAQRRKTIAEAMKAEYEVAAIRRETVTIAEIEDMLGEELGRVRSRLLAVPARVAPACADATDAAAIEALLAEEIGDALSEITADALGSDDGADDPHDGAGGP